MCQLSHKIRGNDKSVRLFFMSKVRTSSLWKLATTALYLNWMVTAHQQYSLTCKSLSTAYSIFVEMATETGMWTGTKIWTVICCILVCSTLTCTAEEGIGTRSKRETMNTSCSLNACDGACKIDIL